MKITVAKHLFLLCLLFLCSATMLAQERLEARDHNQVVAGPGELEVAVSGNGQQVVVAVNGVRALDIPPTRQRLFFSVDRGATFAAVTTPRNMAGSRDPTVAWTGEGKFYFATMGSSSTIRVASSPDAAANFTSVTTLTCHGDNCDADQPHMAGDRRPGQDQVYIVWRNKRPGPFGSGDRFYTAIGCSSDGGNSWFRRIVERNVRPADRRGDYPRVTVGPDGFVYVIMSTSRTNGDLLLQRFSPCTSGLEPFWRTAEGDSAPSRIAQFTGIRCESSLFGFNTIAGLDRCNNGNILASPMVAVDTNERRRVFVSFANEVTPGNHEIVLLSTNNVTALRRNQQFPQRTVINRVASGERYFPWSCATQGKVYVGWYDRRARTARNNDNTEYFVGNNEGREIDASNAIDRQCASGWPSGGARQEAEACSRQPQRAGFCLPCPAGSRVGVGCGVNPVAATPRCDYSSGGCRAGLQCIEPARNRGNGRFGDYNGIACSQGSAYVAWASATAPSGLPDVAGLSVFFARVDAIPTPAPQPPSPECNECREDRNSCMDGAETTTDIRACVQEFNRCRARHNCR